MKNLITFFSGTGLFCTKFILHLDKFAWSHFCAKRQFLTNRHFCIRLGTLSVWIHTYSLLNDKEVLKIFGHITWCTKKQFSYRVAHHGYLLTSCPGHEYVQSDAVKKWLLLLNWRFVQKHDAKVTTRTKVIQINFFLC